MVMGFLSIEFTAITSDRSHGFYGTEDGVLAQNGPTAKGLSLLPLCPSWYYTFVIPVRPRLPIKPIEMSFAGQDPLDTPPVL